MAGAMPARPISPTPRAPRQPNECVENFGFGLPNVASDLPLPVTHQQLLDAFFRAGGGKIQRVFFHADLSRLRYLGHGRRESMR
jgi:hypothetical protein